MQRLMPQKTILIIDDCPIYQKILQTIAHNAGFTTESCATGMAAMIRTNIHMENVAAILLDIYMPDIDGISLLGHFRSKYPTIPVYIFSGTLDDDDQKSALNMGAAQFIQKPMSPETITTFTAHLRAL